MRTTSLKALPIYSSKWCVVLQTDSYSWKIKEIRKDNYTYFRNMWALSIKNGFFKYNLFSNKILGRKELTLLQFFTLSVKGVFKTINGEHLFRLFAISYLVNWNGWMIGLVLCIISCYFQKQSTMLNTKWKGYRLQLTS